MTIFNISDDSTISNEKPINNHHCVNCMCYKCVCPARSILMRYEPHEINPYWDNNCYGQCIVCTDHGHDTTCEICYTRDRASNALRTSMASISIDDYLK